MRRLVAVMFCALLAGAACAGTRDPADAPQPTTQRSLREMEMLAELVGRLEGDPERGCLWIVGDGRPVSIAWGRSFEIRRDPLRLVGPEGQVIARPGDVLSLGGGSAGAGQPIDCKVSDNIFVASSVEVLTPGAQSTATTP